MARVGVKVTILALKLNRTNKWNDKVLSSEVDCHQSISLDLGREMMAHGLLQGVITRRSENDAFFAGAW